ncbi:MAG: LysR family transcriptional regulator [Burkholderiales bacterium]|nr:LysR family transcriptional regulator [Burkholderiales bacterium]
MKSTLQPGTAHTARKPIDRERTIAFMGDELRVYSTPSMCLDIESTCRDLLLAHCDAGEDSVGARIEIDHLGPTLVGQTVELTARVAELALPRVVFEVEVKDEIDTVGRAKHIRFVVDTAKQGERLKRKAEKVKSAKGG